MVTLDVSHPIKFTDAIEQADLETPEDLIHLIGLLVHFYGCDKNVTA